MQDAITSVINSSDVQGKYLDGSSLEKLKSYFATGDSLSDPTSILEVRPECDPNG